MTTFTFGEYLILGAASLLAVGLLTPIMRILARRIKAFDVPSESHKTHLNPVPYFGGIAISMGVVVVTFTSSLISRYDEEVFILAAGVLVPAILMGVVGLVDDIQKLNPWPRFITQTFFGILISGILVSTNTLGSPTENRLLDIAITTFWIVGITNSINFFDNIDGGASGTIGIVSLALFILALQGNQFLIASLSIVLAGATIGFLLWNKPPARIYMGDAGSLFLGILVASLTIRLDPSPIDRVAGFAIPIILLAIPILDTSVAVISRLQRGISPFQGGRDHLSHRLMREGFNKRQAVLILWIGTFLSSLVAITISNVSYAVERPITIAYFGLWAFLFFWFLGTKSE